MCFIVPKSTNWSRHCLIAPMKSSSISGRNVFWRNNHFLFSPRPSRTFFFASTTVYWGSPPLSQTKSHPVRPSPRPLFTVSWFASKTYSCHEKCLSRCYLCFPGSTARWPASRAHWDGNVKIGPMEADCFPTEKEGERELLPNPGFEEVESCPTFAQIRQNFGKRTGLPDWMVYI